MNLKELGSLLKQAFQSWNEDKAARLAAALSFYAVFAIAPVLIIAVAIVGGGIRASRNSDAEAAESAHRDHRPAGR